jgi:hypothetical protein
MGAIGVSGAQDAPMGASPQDSPTAATGGDGVPTSDTTMAAKAMTSPATSEAAAGDPTASTGPAVGAPSSPPQMVAATASTGANNNAIEEPEVSLSMAMGMAHFALNQVHNVLHREREDIIEERLLLSVWVSLLKKRTTFEKEKVEARKKHLDVMEILYNRRQVVADKLDAQAQKLLHNAKELYAIDESHASVTIKR